MNQNFFFYKAAFSLLVWLDFFTCLCSFSLHICNSISCTFIVSTSFYTIFNSFCEFIPSSFIPLETQIITLVFVLGSLIQNLSLTLSCYLGLRRWIMLLFSRAIDHSSSHAHMLLLIVYGIPGFYIHLLFLLFLISTFSSSFMLGCAYIKNGHLQLKFYCFYDWSNCEVTHS